MTALAIALYALATAALYRARGSGYHRRFHAKTLAAAGLAAPLVLFGWWQGFAAAAAVFAATQVLIRAPNKEWLAMGRYRGGDHAGRGWEEPLVDMIAWRGRWRLRSALGMALNGMVNTAAIAAALAWFAGPAALFLWPAFGLLKALSYEAGYRLSERWAIARFSMAGEGLIASLLQFNEIEAGEWITGGTWGALLGVAVAVAQV